MQLFTTIDLTDPNVMLTRDLYGMGYDDRQIARLLARGELRRLRHGAYTFEHHWQQLPAAERRRLRALATLRTARAPVALAGPSAADQYDVPVWELGEKVHLARLDGKAGRREAGKVQHRPSLTVEDITVRGGVPLTSGTRTALDVIALADVPRALVTVNGLLHAGETTPELLARRASGLVHDPHTLRSEVVLRLADGRCESAGESLAFHLCWAHHLPRPELQHEVCGRGGELVARLDFAWPERGLFMEFDGRQKYERFRRPGESVADVVLREKAREDLIRELTGWRCIRIVWADLFDPERTVRRIRAAMADASRAA